MKLLLPLLVLSFAGCAGVVSEVAPAEETRPTESGAEAEPTAGPSAHGDALVTARGAPWREPAGESLRIVVVSDLNDAYGSTTYGDAVHRALDRVVALEPDVVLSTGDMVAGQRAGLDYRGMWRGFHGAVTERLDGAGIPFAPSPGNHDASGYRVFAEERDIYVDEWSSRMPEVEMLDSSQWPLRYSFVKGPVLFVSLDATTVGPLGRAQTRWLEEQLDRGRDRPVKIVYGHVPLWAFAHGREDDIIGDRELERLAVEREVTLWLSGHHHAYYPGRRGPLRLVSQACLGGGPRTLLGDTVDSERSVTVIEADETGVLQLDAYAGRRFGRVIDRATLPESVGAAGQRVHRDDL